MDMTDFLLFDFLFLFLLYLLLFLSYFFPLSFLFFHTDSHLTLGGTERGDMVVVRSTVSVETFGELEALGERKPPPRPQGH